MLGFFVFKAVIQKGRRMHTLKKSIGDRIASIFLTVAFLLSDLSSAYPTQQLSQYHALAVPSAFQTKVLNNEAVFDNLILSIGKYLLGDPEAEPKPIRPLPRRHLEYVISAEFEQAGDITDFNRINIEDGVVTIPCIKNGKQRVVQIALQNSPLAKKLQGDELDISRLSDIPYVIKIVPGEVSEGLKKLRKIFSSYDSIIKAERDGIFDKLIPGIPDQNIPGWKAIKAIEQWGSHRDTVGEHTMGVLLVLYEEGLLKNFNHPEDLLIAAFFHDFGKVPHDIYEQGGRVDRHSIEGWRRVYGILRALGFSEKEAQKYAWYVKQHGLIYYLATGGEPNNIIEDEPLIDILNRITPDDVDLLTNLALADIAQTDQQRQDDPIQHLYIWCYDDIVDTSRRLIEIAQEKDADKKAQLTDLFISNLAKIRADMAEKHQIEYYTENRKKGYNFPYTEEALKTLTTLRQTPITADLPETPVQFTSLVALLPQGDARNKVMEFVERIRQTKAFKKGKVILNTDQPGEYALHITVLHAKNISDIDKDVISAINENMPTTGPIHCDVKGAFISPINGRVGIYICDSNTEIVSFRRRVISQGQKIPLVYFNIATVVKELDAEEKENWVSAIRDFSDFDFGNITIDQLRLVKHTNSFLSNAKIVEEFDLPQEVEGHVKKGQASTYASSTSPMAQEPSPDQSLINQVISEFGLGNVSEIKLLPGGSGLNTEKLIWVVTEKGEFVIKQLKKSASEEEALFVMDYVRYLKNAGIPIPSIHKEGTSKADPKNYVYTRVNTTTGRQEYYIVEKWVYGRAVHREDASPLMLGTVGKLLGRIHRVSEGFKSPYKARAKMKFNNLYDDLQSILGSDVKWPEDLSRYVTSEEMELVDSVISDLRGYWSNHHQDAADKLQMIADDMNFGGILFNEEGTEVVNIVDWDNAREGYRVQDFLPILVHGGRPGAIYTDNLMKDLSVLVKGWEEGAGTSLSPEQRKGLPALIMTQILGWIAYRVDRINEEGDESKIPLHVSMIKRSNLKALAELKRQADRLEFEKILSSYETIKKAADDGLLPETSDKAFKDLAPAVPEQGAGEAVNPLLNIYEEISQDFQNKDFKIYPSPESIAKSKIDIGYKPIEGNKRSPAKTDIYAVSFDLPKGDLSSKLEELTKEIKEVLPESVICDEIKPANYHITVTDIQNIPFDPPEKKLTDIEIEGIKEVVSKVAGNQAPYKVKFLGLRFGTDGGVIAVFEEEELQTQSLRETLAAECNRVCPEKVSRARKKPLISITIMRIFSKVEGDDLARLKAKAEKLKDLSRLGLGMDLNALTLYHETRWMHSEFDYKRSYSLGGIDNLIRTHLPEDLQDSFNIPNLPLNIHREGPELKDHLQEMLNVLDNPKAYKYIPSRYQAMLADPQYRLFFEQFILLHDIGKIRITPKTIDEEGKELQLYPDHEDESVATLDNDQRLAQSLPNRDVLREVIRLHGALYAVTAGEVTPEVFDEFIKESFGNSELPPEKIEKVISLLIACDFLDVIGTHRTPPWQIRVWNFAQACIFSQMWSSTEKVKEEVENTGEVFKPLYIRKDIVTQGNVTAIIIGSPLPQHVIENLEKTQGVLGSMVPKRKIFFNKPEALHISVEWRRTDKALDETQRKEYIKLVEEAVRNNGKPFTIRIKGINLTPNGAIIAQCYVETDEILDIRGELIEKLKIEKPLGINHITLGYITEPLTPDEFSNLFSKISSLRTEDLGQFEANGASIVFNFGKIFSREDNRFEDIQFPAVPNVVTTSAIPDLFKIVKSSVNNERTKFIETVNRLIDSIVMKTDSENVAGIGHFDEKMATAEIRQRIEHAISVIDGLDKESVSPKIKASIESLKKNLNQFEADGAVGALIVLARRAQGENQKLIIGLETDWIPGMKAENSWSWQRQAITALMQEIYSIGEALRSMGLDNVEIVRGSGDQLADSLKKAVDDGVSMRNIVVMASKDTIMSDEFKAFRNAKEKDKPFLTGINPEKLIKLYEQEEHRESFEKQLHIKLTTMLYMTLEVAAGKEPPNAPWIQYNNITRILILIPDAEIIPYEKLRDTYKAEVTALQAA